MSQKPDIRVKVGAYTGVDNTPLYDDLKKIKENINRNPPKIALSLNQVATAQNLKLQLNDIISKLNIKPVKLNFDISTNKSAQNIAPNGKYSPAQYDLTQTKKANANLLAEQEHAHRQFMNQSKERLQAISEEVRAKRLLRQNEKLESSSKQSKLNTEIHKFEDFGDASNKLTMYEKQINALGINAGETKLLFDELFNTFAKVSTKLRDVGDIDNISEEDSAELEKLIGQYQEVEKRLISIAKIQSVKNQNEFASNQSLKNMQNMVNELKKYETINNRLHNDAGISDSFGDLTNRMQTALDSGNYDPTVIEKFRAEWGKLKSDIHAAGLEGQTFGTKLGAQLSKLGVYFTAAGIMLGAWQQLKQMITSVVKLDEAITNLQVATGKTRAETKELLATYSQLGKELGATTTQVAEAADDWLRQGKSIADTNKLIKDSLMLSKLGKIDSSEATTALTAMSKSYGIVDQQITSLVDKLTAVDQVSATTAGGIAKSFQETAVSANLAGISIDRMIGYISTVSEVSQDAPESVGNFFKSFLSRMSNIKEGRLVDEETGEDLSSVETVLDNIGIKLRNNQGQFRNFQQVLDEISVKWKEMEALGDKVGQTKIASALGLTRQQEKAKILFEHYDEAIKYAEISANSLGTAEEKFNNAYLTSTQASMDAFTAQYEEMSNTIWNSDFIKGTFDTGTGLLGTLTSIASFLNSNVIGQTIRDITLLTVAIAGLKAISNTKIFSGLLDVGRDEFDAPQNHTYVCPPCSVGNNKRVYREYGSINKAA
ncbi:MAG: phage tail tape measure protein [Oscillospiraceae bacterium]